MLDGDGDRDTCPRAVTPVGEFDGPFDDDAWCVAWWWAFGFCSFDGADRGSPGKVSGLL